MLIGLSTKNYFNHKYEKKEMNEYCNQEEKRAVQNLFYRMILLPFVRMELQLVDILVAFFVISNNEHEYKV